MSTEHGSTVPLYSRDHTTNFSVNGADAVRSNCNTLKQNGLTFAADFATRVSAFHNELIPYFDESRVFDNYKHNC